MSQEVLFIHFQTIISLSITSLKAFRIPRIFRYSWEHPQQYYWKSLRRFRALEILREKSN